VTIDDPDPVLRGISALPVLTPDARRSAVVREHCRARMRQTAEPRPTLGPALLGSLCVLYLSAIVLDVLRLRGVL
jgi:hypothetical protein